jgi:hypothetical protein
LGGWRTVGDSEGDIQGSGVQWAQLLQVAQAGLQKLMQGGIGHFGLELGAGGTQDPDAAGNRLGGGLVEQRSLAHSGLARQQQRTAVVGDPRNETVQALTLSCPAHEPGLYSTRI